VTTFARSRHESTTSWYGHEANSASDETRQGLGAKELGTELIEDIVRYKTHPSCKQLICFVYDPESRVANPRGIESDLSRSEGDFSVKVIIAP